jgi:CheY-like chemotaxis protein
VSAAGAATILVVDDDREIREILSDVLVQDGFAVATAKNGVEALAYLRASPPPALVLLDLSMPIMDGPTFCEEQQKDARLAPIPVYAFSAAGNIAEKVRTMKVDGYLRKPPDLGELLAVARRYGRGGTRSP